MRHARCRRVVVLLLVWQLVAPFVLPGVVLACTSDAPKRACCVMAKEGQGCPMHAKKEAAGTCRMRCTAGDANPLALVEIAAPLPPSTTIDVSLEFVPAFIPPVPSVAPFSISLDPPPPRA